MASAIVATILFLVFYLRSYESINLIILIPAVIVSGVLIGNSYFMYLGQFQTGYFTAIRVIAIIGGLFSIAAIFIFAQSFSRSGSIGEVLKSFASLPKMIFTEPTTVLVFCFPFFAATTAITSYYIDRAD